MKSKFYLFLAIILLFGVFVSAQNNLLNTTIYMPSDEYFSESKSGTYWTWNKIHYIYLKNNNSANLLSKKINFCMDLFFNSNLKYERVEGDFCNRLYFFKPQKSMVFYYNFSLIYIVLLIMIYFVYVRYYRGKIILEKKIKFLEKSFHGIKKIRVEILISNKTKNDLSNVKISDLIPNILDISESGLGTIKPEVVNSISGKELIFDVGTVEVGERLMVYYDLNSKIDLSEDFSLDDTYLIYDNFFGQKRIKINTL